MRKLCMLTATMALLASGRALPAESPIPTGAQALGYTTKVIDEHPTAAEIAPKDAMKGQYKWFNGAWWGHPAPVSLYETAGGDLAIKYDASIDTGGCLIGTPRDLSDGALPLLDGAKGFYIEFDARLSDNDPNHWPAVWAMPREHSGGNGNPILDNYPGDPAGFERWMELDVDEGSLAKSGGAMTSSISWTTCKTGYQPVTANNWATGPAIDRTKVHTFGASYDPFKRQVTSWLDGKKQWQTPENSECVPEIAARQHFYPILSVWRQDKGTHKSYIMHVSGVRAYAGTKVYVPTTRPGPAANDSSKTSTAATDWYELTCPKTCLPGEEFEIKLDLKNLEKVTDNWKSNKLAVHLYWGTSEKLQGYLGHFADSVVTKDGVLILKGKVQLGDKTASAKYVQVKGYLTDDWANDQHTTADFLSPKIEIGK